MITGANREGDATRGDCTGALRKLRLLLVLLFVPLGICVGQVPARAWIEAICRTCELESTRLAVVDDRDDAPLSMRSRPLLLSNGDIWIAPLADAGRFARFDRTGRLISVDGRFGSGPGEFRLISGLARWGSTEVAVFDAGNGRFARLSVNGRHLGEQSTVIVDPVSSTLISDSELLVTADIRTPALAGAQFHILDRNGQISRSFGGRSGNIDLRTPPQRWHVSPIVEESFWTVPYDRYVLEQWSTKGSLLQRIERQVDWFPVSSGRGRGSPPAAVLVDVWVDGAGLIWTISAVPLPGAVPPPVRREGRVDLRQAPVRRFDTIVEVLDPASSRVLMSRRVPVQHLGFVGPGVTYSVKEGADGRRAVEVWRWSFSKP